MNNPPVAAGLAVSPADWLAVGPLLNKCGWCEKGIDYDEVSLV
jgi:hypothetical protein